MPSRLERKIGVVRRTEVGVTDAERIALEKGALQAIGITGSHAHDLITSGMAADSSMAPIDVAAIVFGNLARERGLHRMWELSLVGLKMLRAVGFKHSRLREFGIGNATTYAALSEAPLNALAPRQVRAGERRVQRGVTEEAVRLYETAHMLKPGVIQVEELREGPQTPDTPPPDAIVSTLFAEYLPKQTMELSVASGAAYAVHADLIHALSPVSESDIQRRVLPISGKENEGEHIVQARIVRAAGGRDVQLAGGNIPVHHDYFDYQLEAAPQTERAGNAVRNLGGSSRESRLTITTVGTERYVRLWSIEPIDGKATPDEIQFQEAVEYTFAEMYRHSQFDAAGLLTAINRAPAVLHHPFAFLRRRQTPLTAIRIVDVEESNPGIGRQIDGWPDATMPANIIKLNVDVLRQLAEAGKLSLVGNGEGKVSVSEFLLQIDDYRDRIRANFIIHNPQGLVAMTALTPGAAIQMKQAFSL